jgi:ribonucleoside-diphosphate reductase beta chain
VSPATRAENHPLPWPARLLNGVEHANFLETRATEYLKAVTRGNWNEVRASFDSRRKAKGEVNAANEGGAGAGSPICSEPW